MNELEQTRLSASIRDRLMNLSREKGEAFDLTLTRFAIERFLYRLSLSPYKQKLILKGAMLFQLWTETSFRPTRDLDLLADGEATHLEIPIIIRQITTQDVEPDGLRFDTEQLSVRAIREEARYGGVRAKFFAFLGSARIPLQIDVGVGDAVTPAAKATDYPTLLSMPAPNILTYPRETVIAEKLEAIVSLGLDNSRMKDYFDLWFLANDRQS